MNENNVTNFFSESACIFCLKSSKRWLVIDTGKVAYCFEHFLEKNPITWPRLGLKAER